MLSHANHLRPSATMHRGLAESDHHVDGPCPRCGRFHQVLPMPQPPGRLCGRNDGDVDAPTKSSTVKHSKDANR